MAHFAVYADAQLSRQLGRSRMGKCRAASALFTPGRDVPATMWIPNSDGSLALITSTGPQEAL